MTMLMLIIAISDRQQALNSAKLSPLDHRSSGIFPQTHTHPCAAKPKKERHLATALSYDNISID